LLNPGEELILFDPSYTCYRPQVQMAGGKTIGIPLIPRKTVYLLELSNPRKNS
jgi:aspartate/methionine/tyrosine aminotransferase